MTYMCIYAAVGEKVLTSFTHVKVAILLCKNTPWQQSPALSFLLK